MRGLSTHDLRTPGSWRRPHRTADVARESSCAAPTTRGTLLGEVRRSRAPLQDPETLPHPTSSRSSRRGSMLGSDPLARGVEAHEHESRRTPIVRPAATSPPRAQAPLAAPPASVSPAIGPRELHASSSIPRLPASSASMARPSPSDDRPTRAPASLAPGAPIARREPRLREPAGSGSSASMSPDRLPRRSRDASSASLLPCTGSSSRLCLCRAPARMLHESSATSAPC